MKLKQVEPNTVRLHLLRDTLLSSHPSVSSKIDSGFCKKQLDGFQRLLHDHRGVPKKF